MDNSTQEHQQINESMKRKQGVEQSFVVVAKMAAAKTHLTKIKVSPIKGSLLPLQQMHQSQTAMCTNQVRILQFDGVHQQHLPPSQDSNAHICYTKHQKHLIHQVLRWPT